jgi:DNA-binding XRE family transcriptional regulator
MGMLGARPFQQEVVQSPWNPVIDVDDLHAGVKKHIRQLLATCGGANAARCLTIHAQPGYGKTHLLSWTRQEIEGGNSGFFAYVPPFHPENGSFEQHVVRSVFESLRHRSHRQRERFEVSVQAFLVRQYDDCVNRRHRLRDLRAGSFWRRLLRPSSMKIGSRGPEEQLSALQRAFQRPSFLRFAFDNLIQEVEQKQPPTNSLRLDWDGFVATCLLAAGDSAQRWYADTWLRNEENIPSSVFAPAHIKHHCDGSAKLLNVLFTLQRVAGHPICLAFDQMETVYHNLERTGQQGGKFGESLAVVVEPFNATSGFCMLFMFQSSIWVHFGTDKSTTNRMLSDRMTADRGPQELSQLDDRTAGALIRQRLQAFVWRELNGYQHPEDNPLFPFTEDEVRRLRKEAVGELRVFLRLAQQQFEKLLDKPIATPRIELVRIDPSEVLSSDPTPVVIRGRHLPSIVDVRFGNNPPIQVPTQPQNGQVEVVTPMGLSGEHPVEVRSPNDPGNSATITIRFNVDAVRRPYREHVDGLKLREEREKLGYSQQQVGDKVGATQAQISNLERGKWKGAPDDMFVKLAKLYRRPLSDFQKQPES